MKSQAFTGQFSDASQHREWLLEALERKGMPPKEKATFATKMSTLGNKLQSFPQQFATTATDTFHAGQGLLKLGKNPEKQKALAAVFHNFMVTLTQDSAALCNNAALVATLIHVVMRVKEAYDSSCAPTDNPKEAQYNQEQSAMTYFREIVGVTLGFVLLKRLQKVYGVKIKKHYQYEEAEQGKISIGQNIGHFFGILNGKVAPSRISKVSKAFVNKVVLERRHDNPINLRLAQIGYALEKYDPETEGEHVEWLTSPSYWKRAWKMFFGQEAQSMVEGLKTSAASPADLEKITKKLLSCEQKGFKVVKAQLPVVLGLIPSVLISGFGIEYASLHYGPQVKQNMLHLMRFLHVVPQEDPRNQSSEPSSN